MEENINTFDLSKNWFYYVSENINVKPIHSHLYFYILNKWNILYWKEQFGLPTDNSMECLNIRSYKTYIKALTDLHDFGFIKIIQRAKNQNTSNIVEVVKNAKASTKASTKALSKASTEATTKALSKASTTIIKHNNYITNNIQTIEKTEKKEVFNFRKELINLGFEKELVEDWLKVRKTKKATNTKTALKSFINEIKKTNQDKNQILQLCVERSWSGFKATYFKNSINIPKPQNNSTSAIEKLRNEIFKTQDNGEYPSL